MKKPKHLEQGDTVAIVSLSAGTLGEPWAIHKLDIAKERLEKDYGLNVVVMPNALKGREYLYEHPEARAADLMDAFRDDKIKAVFNAIGGDDTIRLLPYIDFDVLRNNPKIFTGFSDTTSNHMMMFKAGLCSYYGASIMTNFSEYVKINDYTAEMIRRTLFEPEPMLDIPSAPYWYDDEDEKIWWKEENIHTLRQYHPEELLFYYYEGLAQFQKEDRDAAIDVFQRGISTINDKSNPEIVSDFYAILGDLYYQKGMKKAAYCAYDSCLQWKKDNIGCLNNYAYYMSVEGIELERAEKMSYKTIRQEKENSTYLDTYAWILFKMKRYAEARIYIDKAVEHIDTTVVNTEIYSHAGDIYALNNEIEKAVEFWNKALTLTPNDKLLQKKIRKRKYYTK